MKNLVIVSAVICSLMVLMAISANPLMAQSDQKVKAVVSTIPEQVQKIIDKSCVNCHTEPGKTLALSHINFLKWDQYSIDKQVSKAKAMCNEVSKGKMPPKKFRENNPDAIPTSDEIKIICDWAESYNSTKNQ
jgi:uncharacterized membrane protein